MDIAEMKKRGRELTKGNIWNFWKVYLIVFAISMVLSFITAAIAVPESALSQVLTMITTLAIMPIQVGIIFYLLNIARKKKFEVNNIFEYYKFIIPIVILSIVMFVFIFLWSLLLIVPGIIAALSYYFAMYIFADSNGKTSPMDCIRQSKAMMKGYKGNLFLLGLSFIGWILLGILTLGILYIWVLPYIEFTFIAYYEELKKKPVK